MTPFSNVMIWPVSSSTSMGILQLFLGPWFEIVRQNSVRWVGVVGGCVVGGCGGWVRWVVGVVYNISHCFISVT